MATITKDDFLRCVRTSKVIDEPKLGDFLKSAGECAPKELAIQLVASGLLTKWQAKYLLSGRHVLQIGNYRLLERIGKNDLGDQFHAVHLQLGRKVDLRVFPTDLTNDDERRESFIAKASAAIALDHPNLVHIYDVDQEGGRLYQVVEQVEGVPLNEYSVEELSDIDVARIVKQILAGVMEAHRAGLVHGQLNNDNIVITNDDVVKVQNLALASLDSLNLKTEPQDDINNIGKLGIHLLARTSTSTGAHAKKKLYDLLSWMGTSNDSAVPKIVSQLDEWINENNQHDQHTIISNSPGGPQTSNGSIPSHSNNLSPTGGQRAPSSKPTNQPPATPTKSQTVSPAVLVTTMLIGGVFLIGGVTWFALVMAGYGTTDKQAKKQAENRSAATTPATRNRTPRKNSRKRQPPKSNTPKKSNLGEGLAPNDLENMLVSGRGQEPDRSGGAPAVAKPADDPPPNAGPAKNQAAAADQPNPQSDKITPPPNPNPQSADAPEKKAADLAEQPAAPPKEMAEQPATTPVAESKPAADDNTQTTAATNPDSDQPFKDFPGSFDLPDINSQTLTPIGNINCPKNYLLVAELLSGREICKSRVTFTSNRDPANKQRWIIEFNKRKTDPMVPVAAFSRTENQISFQWLPAAAEHEYAQYLRNCTMKFTSKGKFGFLPLRSPLVIEGFAVSAEQLETKLETELAWLPNLDNLVIELQPFKYGELGGILVNRTVTKKQPGLVFFSEKANQKFVWLEVTAEPRKKLRLTLKLKMATPNGRSKRLSLELLEATATQLKLTADQRSFQYGQIDDSQKTDEITWKEFNAHKKRMKGIADDAQALAADTIELQANLPSLFDKQIPLVISFEMNGMRTILAESSLSK